MKFSNMFNTWWSNSRQWVQHVVR